MKDKYLPILLAGALFAVAETAHAQVLQLNYNFNGNSNNTGSYGSAGNLTVENGAALSAAGTGLLGGTDQALALNATAMGQAGTGGDAVFTPNVSISAQSFTFVTWFKTASTTQLGNKARLFNTNSGTNITVRGGDVATQTNSAITSLTSNGTAQQSNASAYTATQTWTFLAVTYDGTAAGGGLTTWYEGGTTPNSVVQVGQSSGNVIGALPFNVIANGSAIYIGNNGGFNRPFQGLLDDIALYSAADATGALSQGALQTLQNNDLAVPEPSAIAMVLGGFSLLVLMVALRRTSSKN